MPFHQLVTSKFTPAEMSKEAARALRIGDTVQKIGGSELSTVTNGADPTKHTGRFSTQADKQRKQHCESYELTQETVENETVPANANEEAEQSSSKEKEEEEEPMVEQPVVEPIQGAAAVGTPSSTATSDTTVNLNNPVSESELTAAAQPGTAADDLATADNMAWNCMGQTRNYFYPHNELINTVVKSSFDRLKTKHVREVETLKEHSSENAKDLDDKHVSELAKLTTRCQAIEKKYTEFLQNHATNMATEAPASVIQKWKVKAATRLDKKTHRRTDKLLLELL